MVIKLSSGSELNSYRSVYPFLILISIIVISFALTSFLQPNFSYGIHQTQKTQVEKVLTYREHLEATTSPLSQIEHSTTFTFDHVYVLSRPTRPDRRKLILKLADALGIIVTFVDAVDKDLPFIKWIAERVAETRKRKMELISKSRNIPIAKLGGLEISNVWLSQTAGLKGKDPFPSLDDDERFSEGNWVDHLEAAAIDGRLGDLLPSNTFLNVTELLNDPLEEISARQVNTGVISTYWGHTRAMKMIKENGDNSALFLEDDVDIEWDFERFWSRIEQKLPDDWESVLVGHCWGREYRRPAYLHPNLHLSTAPLCLHAYALSQSGAAHITELLANPWSAYTTAIDTFIPTLIASETIKSFSIEPPLIIQRKIGRSDIQPGIGSNWRGLLRDSTLERIWTEEGTEFGIDVYDEIDPDPATVFLGGMICRNCPP